jgi:chemotaxis protein MotB
VTIIIRRDEGEEPAHHGGAWKVAYADFVTAMMAFFMLMWLLNATTEEQRIGLADYFAPTNLFGRSTSGSGQPFGGKTPNDAGSSISTTGSTQVIHGQQAPQPDLDDEDTETAAHVPAPASSLAPAAESYDGQPVPMDGKAARPVPNGTGDQALAQGGDYAAARLKPTEQPDLSASPAAAKPDSSPTAEQAGGLARDASPPAPSLVLQAALMAAVRDDATRERAALEQAGNQIMDAVRRDPALQEAAGQITVETTPQGLRIQVVDAEARPMFALGSAAPTSRVRGLMQKVVPMLAGLSNEITIAGHTDARSYRGQDRGNWELSFDRANATRRILIDAGLPEARIRSVTGNAERDLLVPADPMNPTNRRITVIVLRHAETKAAGTP